MIKDVEKIFTYNPETGEVRWLISPCNSVKKGAVAAQLKPEGYLRITLDSKQYYAHRVAWMLYYGVEPKGTIDHINGIGTDNRICNLRAVSQKVNMRNQKLRSTNTSGVNGVSWSVKRGKWEARICVDGKTVHLGRFIQLGAATTARAKADLLYGFHENHGRIC